MRFSKEKSIKKKIGIKSYKKSKSKKKSNKSAPFLETFVINCDVHKKRLKTFKKYAKKTGLSFEKESCVNGKAYTDQDIVKMIKQGIVSKSADMTPIEVAISLSHYNTWQRFLNGSSKYCLVMEDDVRLHKDFKEKVVEMLKHLESIGEKFGVFVIHPGNWMKTKSQQKRVTKIGKGPTKIQINRETVEHNPSGSAYILSRKFARHLVKKMFPIIFPLDIYIGDNIRKTMPHLTLVPFKDPTDKECYTGPLLNVDCGGGDTSTQDYEVPNTTEIYQKSRRRFSKKKRNFVLPPSWWLPMSTN
jgi:GR25 family glycosyltransferase involved in LPS biosynthesis